MYNTGGLVAYETLRFNTLSHLEASCCCTGRTPASTLHFCLGLFANGSLNPVTASPPSCKAPALLYAARFCQPVPTDVEQEGFGALGLESTHEQASKARLACGAARLRSPRVLGQPGPNAFWQGGELTAGFVHANRLSGTFATRHRGWPPAYVTQRPSPAFSPYSLS